MAMNNYESNFDIYIHDLLKEAGIESEYQHTEIAYLNEALSTASKNQTGESGYPDFIAIVEGYVIVIENKADRDKLCLKDKDGSISQSIKATRDYALNGALYYAHKIIEHGTFTKIFAFGNAGDSKHHTLQPLFVNEDGVKELEPVETFENFSPSNIERYYHRVVLEEEMPEDLELKDIKTKAEKLHEHLRNYGKLGETEKPLVVSAILLALREQKYGFSLDILKGDTVDKNTDGELLYRYLENAITRAKVRPEVKREKILHQFTLIKDRPVLNTINPNLKMTPLKFFADYLNREIYSAIEFNNSHEDYLGRFYGEFVRYSGGDGQTLGVVLTPSHITELFCDLLDILPDDVIFDPCSGTGGFLIAGMHRMLNAAKNESQRRHIREKQIYGIEVRDDMFAIATTNMILRGDGQSNLTCEDFLAKRPDELQLLGITKGLMNPPYSQAKNKATSNLSELNFIYHLLECIQTGGRAAVIVPVSSMTGKTKEDKQLKSDILKHHTLEGVISLNKDTFYGVGTVPCIAIFTAGIPHEPDKLAKFIDFHDDGYEVKMHKGLEETERAKDRRQYLLDCWRGNIIPSSKFMVETKVEESDEWLHSVFYYNDETPRENEFVNSLADYLTFEFSMIVHGRGYLFGYAGSNESHGLSLEGRQWAEFDLNAILPDIQRGKRLKTGDHIPGNIPYVSSTGLNNGIDSFIGNTEGVRRFSKCMTIANSGSVGKSFFHDYEFIASDHVTALKAPAMNKYVYMFITSVAEPRMQEKYSFNREINESRINREKIMLPVDDSGRPDYAFMEEYMRERERILTMRYAPREHESEDG